ncbi:MAG: VOC family protein [Erysipelothrix sp.]|jgi:PhnB protein|nr:VOC family protein [Erysipelothrix sp.]
MQLNVYFNFDSQAHEVMKFYAHVFDTDYEVDFFKDDPVRVIHGSMNFANAHVMFSDIGPEHTLVIGNHITLSLNSLNLEELHLRFERLSEGGTILMPLQEVFWSKAYGMCIDKFGTTWQFNLDEE